MTSHGGPNDTVWAKSHYEVLQMYRMKYYKDIENGTYDPVTYPMISYGVAIGLLFLLVPPQHLLHNHVARYGAFGLISCFHVYLIFYCRALNIVPNFGLGICYGWGLVWSASILIFKDHKVDSWRIGLLNDSLHNEKQMNSPTSSVEPHNTVINRQTGKSVDAERPMYYRQGYPLASFSKRLSWVLDLYTAFRGSGWDFEISSLPKYPRRVRRDLNIARNDSNATHLVSRNGINRYDGYWSLISHNIYLFIIGWLFLDVLKTNANHDPYFWGFKDAPPPSYYPSLIREHRLLLRSYRLLAGMCMVWIGLRTVFCAAPLVFVGILRPFGLLGTWHEPFLYPDHYGSFTCVLDRGLAGFWGGWWHQTFRFAFEAAGRWANAILMINPKSASGRNIAVFVAFTLSGFIHASGAYSLPGNTNPLSGSFCFFAVQPFGLLAEQYWHEIAIKYKLNKYIPRWLARITKFLWVYAWFLFTGPLMTDDLTGGVWLSEPVMISPMRGLGFGVPGDGWLCWKGDWVRFVWFSGNRRWISGVAL